jgi:hypothetical protein
MKNIIQPAMSAGVFARGRALCPDMRRLPGPFFILLCLTRVPDIRRLSAPSLRALCGFSFIALYYLVGNDALFQAMRRVSASSLIPAELVEDAQRPQRR